jgi:hypothetical protein
VAEHSPQKLFDRHLIYPIHPSFTRWFLNARKSVPITIIVLLQSMKLLLGRLFHLMM